MSLLSVEEKIDLLKNLLTDPEDWISEQILILNEEAERERREASERNRASSSPK
jgi:hypothetical protein